MAELTGGDIRSFFIVFAALAALGGGVVSLIKNLRDMRPTVSLEKRVTLLEAKLESYDKRQRRMEDGQKALCRGVAALLSHEINGNSIEKLKKAQEGFTESLIDR